MQADEARDALRELLEQEPVASLATVDADGVPRASLVPFVVCWEPLRLYLFTSSLAAHSSALREGARVGLLVHRSPVAGDPRDNHALVRVSLGALVHRLSREQAAAEGALAAWSARFANIAPTLLGLSDFSFVRCELTEASLVLGFGNAWRATGPELGELEHRMR